MIEQPRLAAVGIVIMALGVLWMGIPYLRRNSGETEDEEESDNVATEVPSTAESTIGRPSEADKAETDTEATASLSEGGAGDGQSVEENDTVVDTELAATTDDCNPPGETDSISENDS